jgi:TonB family protein
MVAPQMQMHGQAQTLPFGEFPTYCFEPTKPLLRVYFSYAGMAVVYGQVERVQGRIVPKDFSVYDGDRRVVKATLDGVNGIAGNAPELTPAPEARSGASRVEVASAVEQGLLLKQTRPVYPQDAKQARASGTVVLGAIIGRDGHVHDLQVLKAPFPSLVAAAMIAVKEWEYKPYLLNGTPVEVESTINVVFNLR